MKIKTIRNASAGLLRMGIYPIVLFIVGEISLSDSIRRLRIVLPLVCFVGLFNPIFDRQVIGHIDRKRVV